MEHISIITKEAITRGLMWPPLIPGVISVLFTLSVLVVLFVKPKDMYDRCIRLLVHGVVCMLLMLVTMGICTAFFPEETGRYKYTATLDPEMTIVEFEEFQNSYNNIRCEDGVWHFEDKEN